VRAKKVSQPAVVMESGDRREHDLRRVTHLLLRRRLKGLSPLGPRDTWPPLTPTMDPDEVELRVLLAGLEDDRPSPFQRVRL
jgi:hypothetical protein